MRLLKRTLTSFTYQPYVAKAEKLNNGRHTGTYDVEYGEPVSYEGHIAPPYGTAHAQMFGQETRFTHVLMMDDPNVDISEQGIIAWGRHTYEVMAVRRSLNFTQIAIRQRTKSVSA